MVTSIQELISINEIADQGIEKDKLIQMILESIAKENDNEIMNNLLFDVIHRNAALNKQLEEQLVEIRRLSITDQLTGIYNRRHFIETLQFENDRMRRYGHEFSIVMFDIDHFKHVNDTYGHDIGDFVLKELSEIVESRLRDSDVFARWGGEEFMILLPETNVDKAYEVAEIIRERIANHNFSPVPKVTSSFGVIAQNSSYNYKLDDLTTFVDQALYKAKETGRNKVEVYIG